MIRYFYRIYDLRVLLVDICDVTVQNSNIIQIVCFIIALCVSSHIVLKGSLTLFALNLIFWIGGAGYR